MTDTERPSLSIGDGYAVYRGPVGGGGPIHRHGAFQIVVAGQDEVAMVDLAGAHHQAAALVVSPMAPHRILAIRDLITYFIEPHCLFADQLRQRYDPGIAAAPELGELREPDVEAACRRPSQELDPRLVTALALLADSNISVPGLAAEIGLSPQRLRALSRRELGMPLTRWRVWSRLRRAVEALQSGMPLAQAAIAAGFADQAHFTRQMREMMGLTPAVVRQALS
ncbi:helix-turn-helix domain-containing protein [Mycolicibacter arupensis]|jgi:AraC-like DNA-binding protein|uniref:Helix-turn-helix domain-containing protein n=1 Tax=Mycolicibacter arupensis TaxID=342002 RepID=A0A5C7Y1J9_9MYCO|nr:helix-turn-helix domain-containing protein [Mycolicibacter arupensis]TXI55472.1 MAG: helix-turn-helix domain-containing protein [Mycolicibacter arupensis]